MDRTDTIQFMDNMGNISPVISGEMSRPVIRVAIPHTVTQNENGIAATCDGNGHEWRRCWALVDTGADGVFVSSDYAKRAALRPYKPIKVQAALSDETSFASKGHLVLIESNAVVTIDLNVAGVGRDTRHWEIVFGMSALRFGKLVIGGPRSFFAS